MGFALSVNASRKQLRERMRVGKRWTSLFTGLMEKVMGGGWWEKCMRMSADDGNGDYAGVHTKERGGEGETNQIPGRDADKLNTFSA